MAKNSRSRLSAAMHDHRLIRFSRPLEKSKTHGYVVALGPQFFLLALLSDLIWFDGFECFRIRDVRNVRPDPYEKFVASALKKRGERLPKKQRLMVDSIKVILASATRDFLLITIHREGVAPGVCRIGRVVGINGGRVWLQEINPDATWDTTPLPYPLAEITRIAFGGDYENALHLVGGDPPMIE